ncbi:MAG: hypothetical protein WBD64_11930 [Candidatus Zixiibacteriota bacterium]
MKHRLFGPTGLPLVLVVAIPYYVAFVWVFSQVAWPFLEPTGPWRYPIIFVAMTLWIAGPQAAIMRWARRFIHQQQKQAQARRDQEAREVLKLRRQLELGTPLDSELPVFFFWFRPFDLADQLPFRISGSWLGWRWLLEGKFEFPDSSDAELDLETCVAAALRRDGVVVSLGRAGKAPGPGKIEVANELWQATVELLGPFASAFFVLPSSSPGTAWEVHWLKENGRLEDSVFIMPPEPRSGFTGIVPDMTDYWHDTRRHLENVVDLPQYDQRGMLIWFANDGAVRRTRRLKRRLSEFRKTLPHRALRPRQQRSSGR